VKPILEIIMAHGARIRRRVRPRVVVTLALGWQWIEWRSE
jgi:hypothetical protein